MNTLVITGGLVALVVLAITIGVASDRQSREQAWRRIAAERRRNWETRQAMARLARRCRKSDCPLRELIDQPSNPVPPDDAP